MKLDWVKLAWAAGAAVALFLVLWFFGALISPKVVYAAFALAAGYLVYTKVALWEIQKLQASVQQAVKK